MSTHPVEHPSSHFREIPRDECEALLGDQTTGRVAWNAPDGPQLLPVSYGITRETSCSGPRPTALSPS